MGDLVRVRTFFPNLWSLNFFAQHIAEQDFFSALYAMSDMFFFSAVYFSPQVFPCTIFPLELSRRDIFLKSLITRSKGKWSALKSTKHLLCTPSF